MHICMLQILHSPVKSPSWRFHTSRTHTAGLCSEVRRTGANDRQKFSFHIAVLFLLHHCCSSLLWFYFYSYTLRYLSCLCASLLFFQASFTQLWNSVKRLFPNFNDLWSTQSGKWMRCLNVYWWQTVLIMSSVMCLNLTHPHQQQISLKLIPPLKWSQAKSWPCEFDFFGHSRLLLKQHNSFQRNLLTAGRPSGCSPVTNHNDCRIHHHMTETYVLWLIWSYVTKPMTVKVNKLMLTPKSHVHCALQSENHTSI